MSKIPLPQTLPGEFFVLEYDKFDRTFTLLVDDEDGSTYDLGAKIPLIMLQFRLWNIQDEGYRAIDMAKEFGAAQCIMGQDRMLALFDRDKNMAVNVFKEQEAKNAGSYTHL